MNATRNPMNVQFWLWGLDAIAGDLTARGFQKLHRPAQSDSSVYQLGGLFVHGHGLWFEVQDLESGDPEQMRPESDGEVLVYRRPSKSWYALPKHATLRIEHFSGGGLAWCDFTRPRLISDTRALETIRPVILEHEAWIAARHGLNRRERQLEHVTARPVRRARSEWFRWLEDRLSPELAKHG